MRTPVLDDDFVQAVIVVDGDESTVFDRYASDVQASLLYDPDEDEEYEGRDLDGDGDVDEDDEDWEDDELSESDSMGYGYDTQPDAPWSQVPSEGKMFIKKNEDAQVEIVFPTVYEEDRTAKLKDLATANGLGTITHRRMSQQMAKELNFEQYDYVEEMEQIKLEQKAFSQIDPDAAGIADEFAGDTVGLDIDPATGNLIPKGSDGGGIATDKQLDDEPTKPMGAARNPDGPQPQGSPTATTSGEGKMRRADLGQDGVTGVNQFKRNMRSQHTTAESGVRTTKRIVRDDNGLIVAIVEE